MTSQVTFSLSKDDNGAEVTCEAASGEAWSVHASEKLVVACKKLNCSSFKNVQVLKMFKF